MVKAKTVDKRNVVLERLKVEEVRLADITPNDYNPNRQSTHDFELLVRSILEDGFTQPVVVQRQTMTIVDGEHRWTAVIVAEAIKQLARSRYPDLTLTEAVEKVYTPALVDQLRGDRLGTLQQYVPDGTIPGVLTDMTAEQMRIATLRHNRARGSEDYDLAAGVLRDLEQLGALDWAQHSLMLDDVEIQAILADAPAPEVLAADDFSQAWEPDKGHVETTDRPASVEVAEYQTPGSAGASAMSQAAVEASRRREERLRTAKTEEERDLARRDTEGLFRLQLMFQGEEADVVRAVLGKEPAQKLLAICRQELADLEAAEAAAGAGVG